MVEISCPRPTMRPGDQGQYHGRVVVVIVAIDGSRYDGWIALFLDGNGMAWCLSTVSTRLLTVPRGKSPAFHVHAPPGPVLRVTDPIGGSPVSILTVLAPYETPRSNSDDDKNTNVRLSVTPGSRLVLQWDFPRRDSPIVQDWVPCVQVSACVQGSEWVQAPSTNTTATTTTTTPTNQSRTRAQQLLLCTAHERIDPETTQRVCLTLLIPERAVPSVSTLPVKLEYECVMDLVVLSSNTNDNNNNKTTTTSSYRNLRLQLPCTIASPPTTLDGPHHHDMEDDPDQVVALQHQKNLWNGRRQRDDETLEVPPTTVCATAVVCPTNDPLYEDWKRLSLALAQDQGWTPGPRPPQKTTYTSTTVT